jgi:hypothetical protein
VIKSRNDVIQILFVSLQRNFKNVKIMMTTLLKQIYHLPVYERMLIVERTIHSIRSSEDELGTITDPDTVQTHYASEQILAMDWLNESEDEAWKSL